MILDAESLPDLSMSSWWFVVCWTLARWKQQLITRTLHHHDKPITMTGRMSSSKLTAERCLPFDVVVLLTRWRRRFVVRRRWLPAGGRKMDDDVASVWKNESELFNSCALWNMFDKQQRSDQLVWNTIQRCSSRVQQGVHLGELACLVGHNNTQHTTVITAQVLV